MKYIDRIISVPEKFNLEIYIHAVHIQLPLQSFLHFIVKGNKKNTKKTEIFPHDQNTSMVFIKSTLVFQVTLYKTTSGYADKFYFFSLMQQTNTKTIKNGKGKLKISSLVESPIDLIDLPLKNCSDPKAYICISASITRFSQALSFSSPSKHQLPVSFERISNSFDYSHPNKESIEIKAKEKFLRRIEVVNSIHNSPQSARILELSDSRSEFSPSSIISPESPERNEYATEGFAIKPILIDFNQKSESSDKASDQENPAQLIEEKNSECSISEDIGSLSMGRTNNENINETEVSREERETSEQSSDYEHNSVFESPPCTMESINMKPKVETIEMQTYQSQKCCVCILY